MKLTRSHEQWAADGTGKGPCAKGRLSVVSSRSRFKRAPDSTGAFSRRVFRGEGATAIFKFKSHLKLEALTDDTTVSLPRKNYTRSSLKSYI